jgi:uncharacterized protein
MDLGTRFGVDVRVLAMDLSDPGAVPELMACTETRRSGLSWPRRASAPSGRSSIRTWPARSTWSTSTAGRSSSCPTGSGSAWRRKRRGGIVLFGSLVGFNGAPLSATYAATKGFVQSFAEGIAAEMRPLA